MPRGGRRVGAGRKPKGLAQRVLDGSASLAERKQASQPRVPMVRVAVPVGMPREEAAIWAQLAPHAIAAGTLTPATVFAFRALIELIVLRRRLLRTITREGWQRTVNGIKRKHPLGNEHRALLVREEAGLAKFSLAPLGREMDVVAPVPTEDPDEPADPFAPFDGRPGDHVN